MPPTGVSPVWMWVAVAAIVTAIIALAALLIGDGDDRAEPGAIVGSGTIATRSYDVGDFSGVRINSVADVDLIQGPETAVLVTTDQNLIEYLDVSVRNDRLVIDQKSAARNRELRATEGIKFQVVTPDIEELRVHGVGSFEALSVSTPALELFVSGVGNIDIAELESDKLIAESTGVSNVDVGGVVQEQEIRWTGVGDFDTGDLRSATADITATGAGSITVWVSDVLDVTSTGSTNVAYYGGPGGVEVNSTVTGIGDLKSLGNKGWWGEPLP